MPSLFVALINSELASKTNDWIFFGKSLCSWITVLKDPVLQVVVVRRVPIKARDNEGLYMGAVTCYLYRHRSERVMMSVRKNHRACALGSNR